MKSQITEEIKPLEIIKEEPTNNYKSLRRKHIFKITSILYANVIILRLAFKFESLDLILQISDWIFLLLLSFYFLKKSKKIYIILSGLLILGFLSSILSYFVDGHTQVLSLAFIKGPNFQNLGLTFVLDWGIIFSFVITFYIYFFLRKIRSNNSDNEENRNDFIQFYKLMIEKPKFLNLISILVSMSILVLFEELIFRYLLINFLNSYTDLSTFSNILMISTYFSIFHIFNYKSINRVMILHLILCFLLSLIFSILMINNGLFFSWLLHLSWNMVLFCDDLAYKP